MKIRFAKNSSVISLWNGLTQYSQLTSLNNLAIWWNKNNSSHWTLRWRTHSVFTTDETCLCDLGFSPSWLTQNGNLLARKTFYTLQIMCISFLIFSQSFYLKSNYQFEMNSSLSIHNKRYTIVLIKVDGGLVIWTAITPSSGH